MRIAREEIGPDRFMMIDANQVWEVDQAIDWVNALSFAKPYFIEEPTSPDDVLDGDLDPFMEASLSQRIEGGGGQAIADID